MRSRLLAALVSLLTLGACHKTKSSPQAPDAGPADAGPVPLSAFLTNTRIIVSDEFRADIEMQLSGEPFAQLLGYQLTGFDRTSTVTDQYIESDGGMVTDPLAYSLAIESYEYSKQPMNNLTFESGAGLSLIWGPLLDAGTPATREGASAAFTARFATLAYASIAAGRIRRQPNLIIEPPPANNPLNRYGWPGLWPQFAEFKSFDPSITPQPGAVPSCSFNGSLASIGYGGGTTTGFSNYECDSNSLNLPSRDTQVDKTITPDTLGYAAWKQGLWIINYWQSMQDLSGNPITQVAPADEASVGILGNSVTGQYLDSTGALVDGVPGTYIGDNPMEGWQGLLMLDEIDNKSALLLSSLLSHDGATLTGADTVLAADNYSYASPLLYFPAAISVTEQNVADAGEETLYFPQPTAFAISDAQSTLHSLSGIIGGFAEAFAMTDANNAQVGGSAPFRITFHGQRSNGTQLFAADDGLPDGESTLHDRALGLLKIALVDLDRLHYDSSNRVLVDAATVSASGVVRGTSVSTVELAASILSLRNAYRALNGSLQLYSNDTPDTLSQPSALDTAALTGAPYLGTLSSHLTSLIRAQADFLSLKLVDSSGAVANSYDLAAGAADTSPTDLASETSAVRALLDAYLATSDEKYRALATTIYADLTKRFWMQDARIFRTTAGVDAMMKYTPVRFAMLQGAMRQYFKLVASSPERASEGQTLLWRLTRMNKLILNGWDDRNGDNVVTAPAECLSGRLQMGERVLTGEMGLVADDGDRDHDCVPEISVVGLPAALGAELDVTRH